MLPQFETMTDYTNSPTLFYPRPNPQPFFPSEHTLQSPASQWSPVNSSYIAESRPKANPRKRSRDDYDSSQEEEASSPRPSSMEVVEEPVYGEGMTLIDPRTGRSLAAESQTGTWYEQNLEEERKAAEEAAASLAQDKLDAQGRAAKSMRFESPALIDAPTPQQPLAATPTPAIDQASLVLGIGWKEVNVDPDVQVAARGWAKYIENHYPLLGGVEILCKSEGLEVFLVKAMVPTEGYWLFKEDLKEGRLVATSFDACVVALKTQPIAFEGGESLHAVESPRASATLASNPVVGMEGDKLGDAMMM